MKIYNYKSKQYVDAVQYNQKSLKFLYNTIPGRFILKGLTRPIVSKATGRYFNSKMSHRRVHKYKRMYKMDINEKYRTFNEFFTRPHDPLPESKNNELIAIADSNLSFYQIDENLVLNVKGSQYTINDLIKNEALSHQFANGLCLVFRLTPLDNHHYFAFDDYSITFTKKIKGILHSVNPISKKYHVFRRNSREVSILETKHYGTAVQIEVGALEVGKIKNRPEVHYLKNDERGYFEYGGSTVILLLNKKIKFADDIEEANTNGYEIQVTAGDVIGTIEE